VFTKIFQNLSAKDTNIAGGKGASLGEMTAAKIPVPPGFVVLAGAFNHFLKETDLNVEIDAILKTVKKDDINSVNQTSEKIMDLIRDTEFPPDIAGEIKAEFKKLGAKLVAVRSSATAEDSLIASWAGELESYLNVSEKNVLVAVKKCWSSLFTPRAIIYRFEKNLQDQQIAVAIVIQKMIQSEISGICFTAHPVTSNLDQIVIEAGWGLGEAVVGGLITPDTYIIKKPKFEILDINVAEQKMMIVRSAGGTKKTSVPVAKRNKQKLTEKQIIALAKLCAQIEKQYQYPQDIEWAIEKNKTHVTQSRPITTLKLPKNKQPSF